jgi:hypothetical protein
VNARDIDGIVDPTHQPAAQRIDLIAFGFADVSEIKNRLIKNLRSPSNRAPEEIILPELAS